MGSAVYDLCRVAAGWLTDIGNWHYSPGICVPEPLIVQEAGGIVRRFRETGVFLYWQEMRRC